MNRVVLILSSIFETAIDALLSPLRGFSPGWGLVVVSVITGIILLIIYGKISNQSAIRNTKRKIYSYILESVLFRQSLTISLKAQAKMLWQGCVYFAIAVPPIIILAIPCILILAQLNRWYESRPLAIGESAILTAMVAPNSSPFKVTLEAPDSLEISPPVRSESDHTISWRVSPKAAGALAATVKVEGEATTVTKTIVAGDSFVPLTGGSYRSFWMSLLYPGDPALGNSTLPLQALWVEYPTRSFSTFGFNLHWIVVFLLVSVFAGIVASRYLKIEI